MKIDTPTLKKLENQKVKYKLKGSMNWVYDTLIEIYKKNAIFEGDTRHFSEIGEIEVL